MHHPGIKSKCTSITRQYCSWLHERRKITLGVSVKNLGVWLDFNMAFKHHMWKLCPRLIGTLMFLNRTKQQLYFKSMLHVINSTIFSHLNYCPTIWGKCRKTLLYDIKRYPNFTGMESHDQFLWRGSYDAPAVHQLDWITIDDRLELHVAVWVLKIRNKLSCTNGIVLLNQRATNKRSTRNGSDIGHSKICDYESMSGQNYWPCCLMSV